MHKYTGSNLYIILAHLAQYFKGQELEFPPLNSTKKRESSIQFSYDPPHQMSAGW